MSVAEWDDEQWKHAIMLVRQWNDQATQIVREMITEDHPATTEAKIGVVASGFMTPQLKNTDPQDHIVWLAIQAATLLVEREEK